MSVFRVPMAGRQAAAALRTEAIVLALFALCAPPLFADVKPGGEKKDKVPDAQGSGREMPEQKKENPLPAIVDQMKQVERRIVDADTGQWTREEQDRIASALDLESKVVTALKALIDEVESRPPSGGSGGASESDAAKKAGGKKTSGKPQQQPKKERNESERDRPSDPAQRRPRDGQKERNDREARNEHRSQENPPAPDYKLDRNKRTPNPGEVWGRLPPKKAREAEEAKRREPPQEWRKQIEDYFRKIAEPKAPGGGYGR